MKARCRGPEQPDSRVLYALVPPLPDLFTSTRTHFRWSGDKTRPLLALEFAATVGPVAAPWVDTIRWSASLFWTANHIGLRKHR
jgi:hypothetical protein